MRICGIAMVHFHIRRLALAVDVFQPNSGNVERLVDENRILRSHGIVHHRFAITAGTVGNRKSRSVAVIGDYGRGQIVHVGHGLFRIADFDSRSPEIILVVAVVCTRREPLPGQDFARFLVADGIICHEALRASLSCHSKRPDDFHAAVRNAVSVFGEKRTAVLRL